MADSRQQRLPRRPVFRSLPYRCRGRSDRHVADAAHRKGRPFGDRPGHPPLWSFRDRFAMA